MPWWVTRGVSRPSQWQNVRVINLILFNFPIIFTHPTCSQPFGVSVYHLINWMILWILMRAWFQICCITLITRNSRDGGNARRIRRREKLALAQNWNFQIQVQTLFPRTASINCATPQLSLHVLDKQQGELVTSIQVPLLVPLTVSPNF